MKHCIYFSIIVLFFASCGPKAVEQVIEPTPEVPQTPTKQEPENPCATFEKLSGSLRDEVETAYVLYKDLVKEGKFTEALPLWVKAYYNAPASNGRIKYQFDDGVAIYTDLYKNATDENLKRAYVDSVMSIYDKRMECFGEEAYTQGRKGFDLYYTFPGVASDGEVYDLFKKNFDVNGKKADYFVVNPFTKILIDRIVAGEVSQEEGRKYADIINQAVDYGLANCKGSLCESWEIINDYAPARLESLEGLDGFYGCEYYANKYYPRFEATPTDCDVIDLVYSRMKRGNCSASDPRLQKILAAKEAHCKVVVEAGPLRKAFDAYSAGQYREAVNLFEDFVNTTDDIEKKAKYTFLIGKIYYGDLKDFSKARKYALDAAKYKSNWGEPYMLIGKLYASSGPLCGSGRGWNSQVVTWPAIDKFQQAKNIDSSVAAEANKLIAQYSQYMPSKEDLFQRRMKEGDAFKVECWIQETTTVRAAK